MGLQKLVHYYAEILPEPEKFLALDTPLPTCIWTNTLKITPLHLFQLMQQEGYQLEQLRWNPTGFRVIQGEVGKSWQFQAGLFQIQEEVSMLPGVLLQAKPGEKVLDLCAAPGNKTAQLAVSMQNRGTLIANDRNYNRMRALGQISKRLGLMNISTVIYDGCRFPRLDNYFDRVLVDAPCSCEGTFRKGRNKEVSPNSKRSKNMAGVQLALLRKAIRLVRAGGRVIYSTCTFSPEENEAVISDLLYELGARVRLVSIKLEGFEGSPGVKAWQGDAYHPEVVNTLRVWPHQNNTGGFYVAMLEKVQGEECQLVPKVLTYDQEQVKHYQEILSKRFQFPASLWDGYQFITDSKRGIYLTNTDQAIPLNLNIDATGMFFLKTQTNYPKLTTTAVSLFGSKAAENTLALTAEQLTAYINKEDSVLQPQQASPLTGTGFVLVSYAGIFLGVGLYLSPQADKPARLRSLFPRYFPDAP